MEKAIKEVGKGYDTLKQLQGLLQLKSRTTGADVVHMHELAEPLFSEALQALNRALRIMKSGGVCKPEVKSEIAVLESGSPAYSGPESVVSYDCSNQQQAVDGRGKKRRVGEHSWSDHTTMPYDDGYQWRKYGDKKITGTNFSRAYFRCTYKEEGCEAKKVVQQITNTDPHMFKVTYTNTHTCKFNKTIVLPSTYTSYQNPFHAIEHGSGMSINQMFRLQECEPISMPELVCLDNSCSSDTVLREDFTGASVADSSCEWDWDSLLRDLEFASGYIPLI